MKAHAMFILICILLLNACTKMPVGTGDGASGQGDIEKTIHYDNYSINGEYPVELQDEVKEIELSATASAPEPTRTAEPILTLSPELTGGIEGIPDPKISNPELFDLTKEDAPIPQFVNAMQMAGMEISEEDVLSGLRLELETLQNLPPFITYRTEDGIALMMAIQDLQTKEWEWKVANPGEYWNAKGKLFGGYYPGNEIGEQVNFIQTVFSNNIIALRGTVRPGPGIQERTPSRATQSFKIASDANASVFFHYIAEPGKFPDHINTENVDSWISERIKQTIEIYKEYNTEKPIYIEYNEPFSYKSTQWNPDRDPYRQKHGAMWMGEFVSLTTKLFIEQGFVPGKDFFIVFNTDYPYNIPRANVLFSKLIEAREYTSEILNNDQEVLNFLKTNSVDLDNISYILLGAQTMVSEATNQKVHDLVNISSGIELIFTEVNLETSDFNKQITELERLSQLIETYPNIKGLIFFNLSSTDGEEGRVYPPVSLMKNGRPTLLFYSALK